VIDPKFKEIVEFAIEREQEAADFYHELQGRVKHEWSRNILKELEDMELGHKKILQNWTSEGVEEYKAPKITDLKISDYLEEVPANEEMGFQDVLITAMKREESAKNLYLDLAKKSDEPATRNLFLKLAGEEAKHKLQLETIYDDEIFYEN
jgi:rubrerythrin